ncbi:MAG: prolyl oligopeptidase family serine peptidase [Candidatus Eisenbacteria bacterium]|nr:prolyl oligopeptidase family serine peptidase [Candidatus Eisenbacteria bacterium]
MKVLLILMTALFAGSNSDAAETGFLDRVARVDGTDYRYQIYVPADYATRTDWPVILALHGSGERGSDGLRPTLVGLAPAIRANPARWPALVVFPQCPADQAWNGPAAAIALNSLDQTMRDFHCDPDRVYLTGLSMGGNGAWFLAYRDPERYAALAPICGWVLHRSSPGLPDGELVVHDARHGTAADSLAFLARRLQRLPTWIFHGEEDPVVNVEHSRQAHLALGRLGADVHYSELPGIGHGAWDPAYASGGFIEWLFTQRRRPR